MNLLEKNSVVKYLKKTIQERMAEEELVRERVDEKGNRWQKVHFGGGEHFRNWLEQCNELGKVEVEEVNATGFKCYEDSDDKLYRIWVKMDDKKKIKAQATKGDERIFMR